MTAEHHSLAAAQVVAPDPKARRSSDTCRVFFLFAPAFKDWPFLIAEEMEKNFGRVEVTGLVTGMENTYRHVSRRLSETGYAPIDHLAVLEQEWLSTPAEGGRLERYETLLGAEALQRLVISDRHLGAGFISGGRFPETILNAAAASDELRQRYIVNMLDYLMTSLQTKQPNLVFCYAIAGAPAYAIAMLCQHLDIPFLRLTHSRVGARHVIDSSPLGLMSEVAELYEKSSADPTELAEHLEEAKDFIRAFRETAEAPQYTGLFHQIQKQNLSTKHLVRDVLSLLKPLLMPHTRPKTTSVRHPTRWQRAKHRAKVWHAARRAIRGKTFKAPDELPQSKFVYFPLHFDPEASTMVFAPFHTNQISIVEQLAKSVAPSTKVVVKEHIPMVGLRPSGFYEQLARLPGVVLASPICSSFDLIRKADATVAITGTAAWEALLLGKPAIVLGQVPFKVVTAGLQYCPNLEKLPEAVATAHNTGFTGDDAVQRYLASIMKSSFDLPYELLWTSASEAEIRAHRAIAQRMAQGILAKLDSCGAVSNRSVKSE